MILLFNRQHVFLQRKHHSLCSDPENKRPLLTSVQLNKGMEFLRYQLNENCAPYGTLCSIGKEKVLEHRTKRKQAIVLQILSEINLDKRNSCCYQTDESIWLALSEKPTLKAHRRRPNCRSSHRYGKGVWYAKGSSSLSAQILLWPETSTKLNKAIKDEVCYPERMTDIHDAAASTINVGSNIKSDNLQLTKLIVFLSMHKPTPSTEN